MRRPPASVGTRSRRLKRLLASLRWRIVGWYAVTLTLALLASLLVVRHLLIVGVEERVQRDLIQEVEELRTLAGGVDPADGRPFGARIDRVFEVHLQRNVPLPDETMLTFVDGRPFLRSLDTPPLRLDRRADLVARWANLATSDRGQVLTEEVGRVDYLAVPLQLEGASRGVFVVAAFTDLLLEDVDEVVRVTALVGLGALLLGMVLAWSVSSRVLAPVREVTTTARAISETDFGRRIDVAGDDEIGHLAATFNAMLDRLEDAFTTQRHFIDDAGHELRTPITIIRGHLELLELEDDPTQRKETVELVLDELDRMARMVEDLLLLARARRPDFLRLEEVDLAGITQEVTAKAQAIAPRRWLLDAVAEGRVLADRQRLTQGLIQLAQNATEHTDAGQVVAVGSAVAGASARIWVRDEGEGIAAEDQSRIFDRFSRGSGSARRSSGAGLGLAIVKAIAEAHGGRLEVASSPGQGATFTMVIPVGPAGGGGPQP